jgi:hypothetical protein
MKMLSAHPSLATRVQMLCMVGAHQGGNEGQIHASDTQSKSLVENITEGTHHCLCSLQGGKLHLLAQR